MCIYVTDDDDDDDDDDNDDDDNDDDLKNCSIIVPLYNRTLLCNY